MCAALQSSSGRRILLAIPNVASYLSFLQECVAAARARGWRVALATDTVPFSGVGFENATALPDKIYPLPPARGLSPKSQIQSARALRAAISDFQPHIVHAHLLQSACALFLAGNPTRRAKRLATFQGLSFPLARGLRRALAALVEISCAKCLDGVWVLTRDDYDCLKKYAPQKVFLQNSPGFGVRPVFTQTPRPSPAQKREAKIALGLNPDEKVALYVGRWVAFKGFAAVARTFLQNSPKSWRCVIVGEGDALHASGLEPAELEALKTAPAVCLAGWREHILPYLDAADALLLPSEREGMSVCLMEALSRGVPAIAGASRGCRELVKDGENGLLIPPKDAAALRAALEKFPQFNFKADPPETYARARWVEEQLQIYDSLFPC